MKKSWLTGAAIIASGLLVIGAVNVNSTVEAEAAVKGSCYGLDYSVSSASGEVVLTVTGSQTENSSYSVTSSFPLWKYGVEKIVIDAKLCGKADYMFNNANKLKEVVFVNDDALDDVTGMRGMFARCEKLESVDFAGNHADDVTDIKELFSDCSSLEEINMPELGMEKIYSAVSAFSGCESLEEVDFSGWDCKELAKIDYMFSSCVSLESIDMTNLCTDKLNGRLTDLFLDCQSLTEVDLSAMNTRKIKRVEGMFKGCSSLTSLDLTGFDTDGIYVWNEMFADCTSLLELDLSNFVVNGDMGNAFNNDLNLTYLKTPSVINGKITLPHAMSELVNESQSGVRTSKLSSKDAGKCFVKSANQGIAFDNYDYERAKDGLDMIYSWLRDNYL